MLKIPAKQDIMVWKAKPKQKPGFWSIKNTDNKLVGEHVAFIPFDRLYHQDIGGGIDGRRYPTIRYIVTIEPIAGLWGHDDIELLPFRRRVNVAWPEYNILTSCNEVTKQANV
jgi:hypothetical protein